MFFSRFDAIFFSILSYFYIICHIFTFPLEGLKLTPRYFDFFFCLAYGIVDEQVCHWNTFSSLIEVLLQACVNVPLEISLQECSYFQQILFAEFLPGGFFQSKVRKMNFYAWHLGFILKLPIVFIHSFIYCCLRVLCKIACSWNLLIIKLALGAFLFCPKLYLLRSNECSQTEPRAFLQSTQDRIMYKDAFVSIHWDVW